MVENMKQINVRTINMIGVKRVGPDTPQSIGELPYFLTLVIFISVLAICGIVSLLAPKPTISQIENRPLETAPAFSAKALMSGDFTDTFSLYYSDTFPLRERMIEAASGFRGLFGVKGKDDAEIFIGKGTAEGIDGNAPAGGGDDAGGGADVTGDETIDGSGDKTLTPGGVSTTPDAIATPGAATTPPSVATTPGGTATTPSAAVTPGGATAQGDTDSNSNAGNTGTEIGADTKGDVQGGLIVLGDTSLEFYGFSKKVNTKYTKVINRFDKKYKSTILTNVMVVPTNVEFKLPKKYRDLTRPQDEAIDFIYGNLSSDINKINIYNDLKEHANEYIYFRTDHHWTALGAYYAYREYCIERGFPHTPLGNYSQIRLDGFLGSFYNAVGGNKKMKKNPDYVIAYPPVTPYKMAGYEKANGKGEKLELSLVRTPKEIPGSNKYLAFSGGDMPYIHITTEANTGRRLIIFKESYANAFIPFLTENYDEICVVDFRYFTGSVDNLIKKNNIKEALFLNYVSAAGSSRQVDLLESMLN
jgi:hypothetical protein